MSCFVGFTVYLCVFPGGDPWRIPQEERAKHDAQFFSLTPSSGMITGESAYIKPSPSTLHLHSILGIGDTD